MHKCKCKCKSFENVPIACENSTKPIKKPVIHWE